MFKSTKEVLRGPRNTKKYLIIYTVLKQEITLKREINLKQVQTKNPALTENQPKKPTVIH